MLALASEALSAMVVEASVQAAVAVLSSRQVHVASAFVYLRTFRELRVEFFLPIRYHHPRRYPQKRWIASSCFPVEYLAIFAEERPFV